MELLLGLAVIGVIVYYAVRPDRRPRNSTPPPPPRPPQTPSAPRPSRPSAPPRSPAPPRPRAPEAPQATTAAPPSLRTESLLDCLAFLRHEFGADWSGVMEPFSVNPRDALDVNHAVQRLATHVRLRGLRFIVGIGRLAPDMGGHIELQRDQVEVFIDVAPAAARFGPSLLAVLSHEVTHKVLFDRKIHQDGEDPLSYEILTDVTAIYLGLGKLLLNGYEYGTTEQGAAANSIVTRRLRFGYVSIEEVAFVHAMACRMRDLPPSGWARGLSPFARRALSRVVEDANVRRHLDAAPMLTPQRTYQRPAPPPRASGSATRPEDARQPRGGVPITKVGQAAQPPQSSTGISPEAQHLRDRLLELVYGDDRLATRLVAFEQRHQLTLEASYKAAINRLIRDRS